MKKYLLLLVVALSISLLKAAPTVPTFTTAGDTTWYFIQFTQGGNYLASRKTNGSVLNTASAGATVDSMKWCVIGTTSSFRLYSKTGYYAAYNSSSDRYVTSTSAYNLKMTTTTQNADSWDISPVSDNSNAMNQWGGTGKGVPIGGWNTNDINDALKFIKTTPDLPTFSTSSNPVYYFLQFPKQGTYFTDAGSGNLVSKRGNVYNDNQYKWRLEGDKSSFKLVSATGNYLYVNNGWAYTTNTAGNATTFSLRGSTNSDYFLSSWQIYNGNGALNNWSGGSDARIGVWNSDTDPGNCVKFTEVSQMNFPEYRTESSTTYSPAQPLSLWYTTPPNLAATSVDLWKEYALPLGNGQLGATFFGNVKKERIQFNEKTLWQGSNTSYSGSNDYVNFGDLYIANLDNNTFDDSYSKSSRDYYRVLDLKEATGKVHFASATTGQTYDRQYFVSNPDNVIVLKLSSSGSQNYRLTLVPGQNVSSTYNVSNGTATMAFSGSLKTVSYSAYAKVVSEGATFTNGGTYIDISSPNDIYIFLAGGTNFSNDRASESIYTSGTLAQVTTAVQGRVNTASAKSWTTLYNNHVADFQNFFNRVNFSIDGAVNDVPTNTLIDNYNSYKTGNLPRATMLEQLYFAYGRYLEISSSRGVDLPNNLQGIWNHSNTPPWGSDIHANINVQMNYWPAEPTNLSEMHVPFLNYIIKMANSPEWKSNITDPQVVRSISYTPTRGWTCFTENNIFGGEGSFAHYYCIANAWYVTHLWQHYRYTMDTNFLAEAFPAMLSATQFWIDRLKLASDGTYECPQEYSPEQGPYEDGVAHAQQLVRELLENTLAADSILGSQSTMTSTDRAALKDRLSKLDLGLHTETYTGNWGTGNLAANSTILREWKYSAYTVGSNGHRHPSHLMCLYPFSQVEPGSPLYDAAVNSLRLRGDGATGWSMGWKVNLWARALDGDHARTILGNALSHCNGSTSGVFYNLFDVHSPNYFQIDGNFGSCSGIGEMIMQGATDTIRILPALPTAWASGSMTGMKAAGNFEVNTAWQNNAPTEVTVKSVVGSPLNLKYDNIGNMKIYVNDVKQVKGVGFTTIGDNVIHFNSTTPNSTIKVVFEEDTATLIGDADISGNVDVADVVASVNYILGNVPSVFSTDNANTVADTDIDVADLVMIVEIILGNYDPYASDLPADSGSVTDGGVDGNGAGGWAPKLKI